MVYSEKQYKILEAELKKLKKENELKTKENRILKSENKKQKEIIQDLDRYNYRGQYQMLKLENEELKKKLKTYEEKFELARISLKKDSSNSCKPSSTDGYKKVIQNNRVKSGKKPGREKGHKKSSPEISAKPDEVIRVSKVATCKCGCKTVEKEDITRELVSMKVITYITHYVGKKQCVNVAKKSICQNFQRM